MNAQARPETEAELMVRELCNASGSEEAVMETMRQHVKDFGLEGFMGLSVEALFLTYSRALTCAVPLDPTNPTPSLNEGE